MVQDPPVEVSPLKLYGILAGNGAETTTGAPPQLLVKVTVPDVGGSVMPNAPLTLYVLVAGLQAEGVAVKPVTPHNSEQLAEAVPPVCEKVMVPGCSE
jgi:hypothetical protein